MKRWYLMTVTVEVREDKDGRPILNSRGEPIYASVDFAKLLSDEQPEKGS